MRKKTINLALTGISCLLIATAFTYYQQPSEPPLPSSDPKAAKLKLPEGFRADRLYAPSEHGEGSWVSMTFDPKGRIIASDQYGYLYRITVPAIGDTVTMTKAEKLEVLNDTALMNQKNTGKNAMG